MPHVWRVVATIEVMIARLNVAFEVDDQLFTYLLDKGRPGQYMFGKRPNREVLSSLSKSIIGYGRRSTSSLTPWSWERMVKDCRRSGTWPVWDLGFVIF